METEIKVWLSDIEQAINEINDFLPAEKNFFKFQKDIKTKRAVERNIEIIGEAVKRILSVKPDIVISNARKIVDTRNRITHGYDSVSEEILWSIVIKDLPSLNEEIKILLKNKME
ncbi:MAG TPA: antitoxin [Bacteroidetes bacterium]|nr:antitoxin [Bacteroidota bacterium]